MRILYFSIMFSLICGCGGLDRVKGVKGKTGDKGEPGEIGPVGPEGPAGKDGAPGKDGNPGKDGKDGNSGKDGVDGKDGAPGKDGEDCKVVDKGTHIEIICGTTTSKIDKPSPSSQELVICTCIDNFKRTVSAKIEDINAGKYRVLQVGPCKRGYDNPFGN